MKNYVLNSYDLEAAKRLEDFLPDCLFDAHMHISHNKETGGGHTSLEDYFSDTAPLYGGRPVRCNAIVHPGKFLADPGEMEKSVSFLAAQMEENPGCAAEVQVLPDDTAQDIEKRLVHPAFRGLKCYHVFAHRTDTFNASVEEYLPEGAWEVADQRGLAITLHLVKNEALADPDNRNYVKEKAKQYPGAKLILAHAARSFAAWTVFDTVDELKDLENVWFDFSGICESPSLQYVLKTCGVSRCMWGTDYPISLLAGKAVSIADRFYWIGERELKSFVSKTDFHSWHVATEGLYALRQACVLQDLSSKDIEDLFYNNAARLWK